MTITLQRTPTRYSDAANAVKFAYRYLGNPSVSTNVLLVLHIHFRANMGFWDPVFINALAAEREVIVFDNADVGRSSFSFRVCQARFTD